MTGSSRVDSLALRLVASASLLAGMILLVAGLVLSTLNRRTVEHAFDERLKIYLLTLIADLDAFFAEKQNEPGNLGEPRFNITLSGWYWQILRLDAEKDTPSIFRSSRSLSSARLPLIVEQGPATRRLEGREASVSGPENRLLRITERTIDLGNDGQFVVSVAADQTEIGEESAKFDRALLVTFIVLGTALALSTLIQVRFGLAPLMRLRASLTAIRRGEAEHVEGTFPSEIAPVAMELNQLVDANRAIIERSRTQVGNLAHALKTPLSVLVNEADAVQGPLAEKVREQTALMRDQMLYYLDRARVAARAVAVGTVCNVEPVLAGFTRVFETINQDRGIRYIADVDADLKFCGEKQDFEEMVGNLADNAGKWARSTVRITASVREETPGMRLTLTIDDDGPGLSAEQRLEAVRRGRRLDETVPGSGLGLSIVADLASLYGGRLSLLDAPTGGLRAELELPAA